MTDSPYLKDDDQPCDDTFDVVIVGGGISGFLISWRLSQSHPDWRVGILEKQATLGGRLRGSDPHLHQWSCGLQTIDGELFNYWHQIIATHHRAEDLYDFVEASPKKLGILQAGQLKEIAQIASFAEEGAKAIGGAAAARDWSLVEQLQEYRDDPTEKAQKMLAQAFHHSFAGSRKSPSGIVLEHLSRSWGVADLWNLPTEVLLNCGLRVAKPQFIGRWQQAMDSLMALTSDHHIEVFTNREVVGARWQSQPGLWLLKTQNGPLSTPRLIVACSPWEALYWLPRQYWPASLLAIAQRCKPVSMVVLSERRSIEAEPPTDREGAHKELIATEAALPETIIVPAENVQIVASASEITYQSTLDYELTLQAPDAVKAVKRLKRARKKLHQARPSILAESEHIALIPVAWCHPTTILERRLFVKLAEKSFQSDSLMFCGDAYGSSLDSDQNIVHSVSSVFEQLSGEGDDKSHLVHLSRNQGGLDGPDPTI